MASVSGCSYHLRGYGDDLPKDVDTITLLTFDNDTYEADMEIILSQSLAEEFSRGRRLRVVRGEDAGLEVSGEITSFTNSPISFLSSDVAKGYRLEVEVDVTLKRKAGGEVIWKGRGIKEIEDYQSVPGNIGATESNKYDAKKRIADNLADLIYTRILEGF